jgi:polar amino acid transport system substrate-binding protein
LKNYKINGISGYNYSDYGLAPGDLSSLAKSHSVLIQQLHRKRCDLVPEWFEVMVGFAAIGTDYLADPDLGSAPVPGLSPSRFHLVFTKNEEGLALKQAMDKGLLELRESGRLEELLRKHVPR